MEYASSGLVYPLYDLCLKALFNETPELFIPRYFTLCRQVLKKMQPRLHLAISTKNYIFRKEKGRAGGDAQPLIPNAAMGGGGAAFNLPDLGGGIIRQERI